MRRRATTGSNDDPPYEGARDLHCGSVCRGSVAADANESITFLSGLHAGCYELFANEGIRNITDLKGKKCKCTTQAHSKQLVSIMASYVRLDPDRDIQRQQASMRKRQEGNCKWMC
jgi:hypothetical protein